MVAPELNISPNPQPLPLHWIKSIQAILYDLEHIFSENHTSYEILPNFSSQCDQRLAVVQRELPFPHWFLPKPQSHPENWCHPGFSLSSNDYMCDSRTSGQVTSNYWLQTVSCGHIFQNHQAH